MSIRWFLSLLACGLLPYAALLAQGDALAPPIRSVDDAMTKVKQDTGGTILSAEQVNNSRPEEYRIKVLTPQGHIKVIRILAESARSPLPTTPPSTKNPALGKSGNKEKH